LSLECNYNTNGLSDAMSEGHTLVPSVSRANRNPTAISGPRASR
jgi:hypothetical protein